MKRILMISLLILPVIVYSQYSSGTGQGKKIIRATLVNQYYSVEDVDDPIVETTFPIEIIWPVNSNFSMQILSTPALSSYGDLALSGMSDIYLRSNYTFLENKALVSVGLGAPTGVSELDPNEFAMSQVLSVNALRFRLPVLGQGFTGSLGFAYAHPLNDKLVAGAGINYVFRAKYKPIENSVADYNPGDQVGTNIGMDIAISENARFAFDLLYTYYTPDKIRDREAFGSGDKLSANMSFMLNMDQWTFFANSLLRQKGKNEYWIGTGLESEPKNSNGMQFELDGIGRYEVNNRMGARVFLELRAYGENEYKTGDAAVFGLGGGFDYVVSKPMTIEGGLKGYYGRLGGGTNARSLTGFEIWIGTAYTL